MTPLPLKKSSLLKFISMFYDVVGAKILLSIFLFILLGLTEGIGLFLIIPLLDLIGFGGASPQSNPITDAIGQLLDATGLPINLLTVLLIYLTIITIHSLMQRYHQVFNAQLSACFVRSLTDTLHQTIVRAQWLRFIQTKGADLIHVLTNDIQRVSFGTQELFRLVGMVVLLMIHIGVALTVSFSVTVLVLASAGGLLFLVRPFNRKIQVAGVAMRNVRNVLLSSITELIGGINITKSYGLEKEQIDQFQDVTHEVEFQTVTFASIQAQSRMFFTIGSVFAISLYLFITVEYFDMPTTQILFLGFLLTRILPKISSIHQSYHRIIHALPCFKATLAMQDYFEAGHEIEANSSVEPHVLKNDIVLENVSFRYDDDSDDVLQDLNLTIPARKITAITGASGGGKSTLAALLMGLAEPNEGQVLLDGKPLTGEIRQRWQNSVGYVPQETFLYHDTIRANLLVVYPTANETEIWQALEMASAEEFVRNLPNGLNTIVGDRGTRLSGGERQRIALARALIRKPTLLLLDEATSNLDHENEKRIQESIENLHGDLTIVIIAHRLSTIENTDARICINKT